MNRQVLLTALIATACSEASTVEPGPNPGSTNVTQGGAQDIAHFRSIVDEGQIPSPDTLDEVGFFAEHAIDLPPADCGASICMHPMLAVAPKFDGSNWTMAFVAMNSPVKPETAERPDAHVVVMIEDSFQTRTFAQPIIDGLEGLAAGLGENDLLTIGRYGTSVRLEKRALDVSQHGTISELNLSTSGSLEAKVSVYEALQAGRELADNTSGRITRIVLLTTGRSDGGITDRDRILGLAESMAERGVSISVVGYSPEFDDRLPLRLGEIGAGTYSYAETAMDLTTVLRLEGETSLYPLGRDLEMVVRAAPGYTVGEVYGAKRIVVDEQRAILRIPALFLGHRTGSQDVKNGRRGGGGGVFVRLIADPNANIRAGAPAFTLSSRWVDAATQQGVAFEETVINTLPPGQNPDAMWPEFSDPARGKAFMMLNMYLALHLTVDMYEVGDCDRALGTVEMMDPSVEAWQAEYDDPDIEADWDLLLKLESNLQRTCGPSAPRQPIAARLSCMGI